MAAIPLYVTGFPRSFRARDIAADFEPKVGAKVFNIEIPQGADRKAYPYAFVTFFNEHDTRIAIERLHKRLIFNTRYEVSYSRRALMEQRQCQPQEPLSVRRLVLAPPPTRSPHRSRSRSPRLKHSSCTEADTQPTIRSPAKSSTSRTRSPSIRGRSQTRSPSQTSQLSGSSRSESSRSSRSSRSSYSGSGSSRNSSRSSSRGSQVSSRKELSRSPTPVIRMASRSPSADSFMDLAV